MWLLLLRGGQEPGRERAAHLLKLRPRRHLLREERGLNAVEEALEPADELGLRHPQLRLAWRRVPERQRQPLKLLDQLRGEAVLKLLDGVLVDLLQPRPALLVERRGLNLLKQLADHRADPHDLGRLLDHLGYGALRRAVPDLVLSAPDGHAVGSDDDDLGPSLVLWADFAH